MKTKGMSFIALLVSMMFIPTMFFTSCDNDNLKNNEIEMGNAKINSFFLSLDKLNENYLPHYSRIDVEKWGSKFLSATVDGCVGFVASAATTPLGGTIIGTGASWAYDEYLEGILSRSTTYPQGRTPSSNANIPYIIYNTENATIIDSIGYYHNKMLVDLSNLGKEYSTSEGSVNTNEILKDLLLIAKKYNISYEFTSEEQLNSFSLAINSFIANLEPTNGTENSFLAFNSKISTFGILDNDLYFITQIGNKINSVIPYITIDNAIKYGEELHFLIESSSLNNRYKELLHILNNISINSKLYWSMFE